MYERKSRLSGKQRGKMIEMFVAGATARAAAEITGVNRNTVRIFYERLRQLIASGVRQAVCNLLRFLRADLTFSKTSFALAVHMNG